VWELEDEQEEQDEEAEDEAGKETDGGETERAEDRLELEGAEADNDFEDIEKLLAEQDGKMIKSTRNKLSNTRIVAATIREYSNSGLLF